MVKRTFTFVIILLGATALSQKVTTLPVVVRYDSTNIDLDMVNKIDSINSDTYKAALRVQKKAVRLIALSKLKQSRSATLQVSELKPREITINLPPPEIDSIPFVAVKHKRFWLWRRDK